MGLHQELKGIDNWEDRYRKLIEAGKNLPPIADQYRTSDYLVRGCQAQVWLNAEFHEGRVLLSGSSDALIVSGLMALVFEHYSGLKPDEIIALNTSFISELGLGQHLTPSRANGLQAMIKQIKIYALAFKEQQRTKS